MCGHWRPKSRHALLARRSVVDVPMNFNFTTKATTFGFVGGVDRTYRNFGAWRWYANSGNFDRVPNFRHQVICN